VEIEKKTKRTRCLGKKKKEDTGVEGDYPKEEN